MTTTRGVAAFQVDGEDVGQPLDQYAPDPSYPTTPIGRVRFSSEGSHRIRLQVVGQNAASSAFILSADRFILRR